MAAEHQGLIIMNVSELQKMKDDLLSSFREELKSMIKEDNDLLIGYKAISSYLGLSVSGFKKRVSSKKFPLEYLHKRDGTIYAFKHELILYIKNGGKK